jgi:hypothetical protein
MGLITQKPTSVSWESIKSYVCDILLEIKDIKYNKVPWTETVIKLNICQKWGEEANTSIFFVANEQLNYKLHVQCWYCHNLNKDRTLLKSRNSIYPAFSIILVC